MSRFIVILHLLISGPPFLFLLGGGVDRGGGVNAAEWAAGWRKLILWSCLAILDEEESSEGSIMTAESRNAEDAGRRETRGSGDIGATNMRYTHGHTRTRTGHTRIRGVLGAAAKKSAESSDFLHFFVSCLTRNQRNELDSFIFSFEFGRSRRKGESRSDELREPRRKSVLIATTINKIH